MRRLLLLMAAPALLAACSGNSPSAAPTTTAAVPPPASSGVAPAPATSAGGATSATPAHSGTPTQSDTPAHSDTPASGPARCHTGELAVRLGGGEGAAGTQYVPLVFTNRSGHRCTLYGYPGVSFVAGDAGTQVNKGFTREPTNRKITVTLAPGAVAHATIAGSDVGFFEAGQCKPVSVRGFRVYPPDETASLFVAAPWKACSAAGVGLWRVGAITAGAADR